MTKKDTPKNAAEKEEQAARNERMALGLAAGRSAQAVANEANVCLRTVRRRLQNPKFCKRVADLRGAMVRQAAGKLANSMGDAADALSELLVSDSEVIRLRAADQILAHGTRVVELEELQSRVAEIEKRLAGEEVQ
jgi:hypothetical protein